MVNLQKYVVDMLMGALNSYYGANVDVLGILKHRMW